MDAGVKMAIENHAGDMQARELKSSSRRPVRSIIGVCIDSGNAVWTIEDPHLTLETLAPYVATSHMRDSALFNSAGGAAVGGRGSATATWGWSTTSGPTSQKCPGKAISLESSSAQLADLQLPRPEVWELFKATPAWEFSRFLALCDKGKPTPATPRNPATTPQAANLAHVEASVTWTQAFLAKL